MHKVLGTIPNPKYTGCGRACLSFQNVAETGGLGVQRHTSLQEVRGLDTSLGLDSLPPKKSES